ncbi:MAG TPA: YciI family protein [Terriglobia bacterium]|nr:YciI family protein [Terriglobia bacterium]
MLIGRFLLPLLLAALLLPAPQAATPQPATPYYVVFLRPDPARKPLQQADGERIMAAHMANIHKMADDGVLAAAGPFDDTPVTISGIFVLKTGSLESAQAIAAQDPTVIEHRNTVDVHAWRGPAGIGAEYFRLHKLDPKTPQNMQVRPFCMLYRGSGWEEKAGTRDSLLRAHERYLDQLREQGKLNAAGGIEAPDDLLGLVIFKPIALDEAQRLLGIDPAVQAGVLRVKYHHWWSADHVLPW